MVAETVEINNHYTAPYFLSCDWGTSSFRLKLVEADSARVIAEVSGDTGIKKLYSRWQTHSKARSRAEYYRTFLGKQLGQLQKKVQQDISALPVLISGMASSSIGMKELPYRKIPVSLDHPDLRVEKMKATGSFPHTLYLISGVRSSEDVMRGEETQIIGLSAATEMKNGMCLLLGTHSKHITIKNNTLVSFRTYMTGELFDLLSTRSILADSVAEKNTLGPGPAFEKGVSDALQENLLHTLFKTRTRDLLDHTTASDNYDYLSGLLIGTELKEVSKNNPGQILLWGNKRIAGYYKAALNISNIHFMQPEPGTGKDITALGHRIILTRIDN